MDLQYIFLHQAECSTQALQVNVLHVMPVMSLWHQVALGLRTCFHGLNTWVLMTQCQTSWPPAVFNPCWWHAAPSILWCVPTTLLLRWLSVLATCTADTRQWYTQNGFQLNPDKSTALVPGTSHQLRAVLSASQLCLLPTTRRFCESWLIVWLLTNTCQQCCKPSGTSATCWQRNS